MGAIIHLPPPIPTANTGATANRVEPMWQKFKRKIKAIDQKIVIYDYFAEFTLNQRLKYLIFYHFWHQITRDFYPVYYWFLNLY